MMTHFIQSRSEEITFIVHLKKKKFKQAWKLVHRFSTTKVSQVLTCNVRYSSIFCYIKKCPSGWCVKGAHLVCRDIDIVIKINHSFTTDLMVTDYLVTKCKLLRHLSSNVIKLLSLSSQHLNSAHVINFSPFFLSIYCEIVSYFLTCFCTCNWSAPESDNIL
jgi:hypothetical protein